MVLLGSWNPCGLQRHTGAGLSPRGSTKPDVPRLGPRSIAQVVSKREAYRGEVQVTDTLYVNSPAPMTLILGYRSPSAPRNLEPGLAGVSCTSGPIRLRPLPSSGFSVDPFKEVPVLIPRPGGLPHPADPQAQGSGHKHHTLSTSRMRSGHQA